MQGEREREREKERAKERLVKHQGFTTLGLQSVLELTK